MQVGIKADKATIMAVRDTDSLVNNVRPMQTMSRSSDPVLRQPTFDWKATNK